MISTIMIMSSITAVFTIIPCLLRPLLKGKISASARAATWCVVLVLSIVPVRLTLPHTTPAPIPPMRQTMETIWNGIITPASTVPAYDITAPAPENIAGGGETFATLQTYCRAYEFAFFAFERASDKRLNAAGSSWKFVFSGDNGGASK